MAVNNRRKQHSITLSENTKLISLFNFICSVIVLEFMIEIKMTTTFRYTLTKSLRNYTKYIPQLSKPVLRVLIQGKYGAHENQCQPNFW